MTREFDYDANGNMTQKNLGTVVVNYIYNADNRLFRVEDELTGTVIAEYYYDPFGRRLWKDVGGTRTYFFYSDEGLVAEFDISGSEVRSYGYQPDSTWTTDPLWLKHNNAYYFYHNDHLGTPQKLTAQNGMVAWSAQYSAFGEATVDSEFITNNLRFPGQYFDAETGLHYNWHRYYDPKIGRYVNVDPVRFDEGETNWYRYVQNRPLNLIDPEGKNPLSDFYNDLTRIHQQSIRNWELIEHQIDQIIAKKPSLVAELQETMGTYCPDEGIKVQTNYQNRGVSPEKTTCCPTSCREQARIFSRVYMEHVTRALVLELYTYGFIAKGFLGNSAYGHGVPKPENFDEVAQGLGLKCEGWSDLASTVFEGSLGDYAYNSKNDKLKNTLCFRGGKIRGGRKLFFGRGDYHQWFVIYSPALQGEPKASNGSIILDPWLTGGEKIIYSPDSHPYEGVYFFWDHLFKGNLNPTWRE